DHIYRSRITSARRPLPPSTKSETSCNPETSAQPQHQNSSTAQAAHQCLLSNAPAATLHHSPASAPASNATLCGSAPETVPTKSCRGTQHPFSRVANLLYRSKRGREISAEILLLSYEVRILRAVRHRSPTPHAHPPAP